jgi:hypothetical protein
MQLRKITAMLGVAALLGAAACAAPMEQEPVPNLQPAPPEITPGETPITDASFGLEIENPFPHTMSITYKIGDAITVLGEVESGQTVRYTIPNRGADLIELTASDPSNAHVIRRLVDLDKGKVVRITLTNP